MITRLCTHLQKLAEGLTLVGSYQPQGGNRESATGVGINYTGFDGLTVNYANTGHG